MKSKNEWYLVQVEKIYLRDYGSIYLRCTYSNGLIEMTLDCKHGDYIKTILEDGWLD
jgi:hypothetical protein